MAQALDKIRREASEELLDFLGRVGSLPGVEVGVSPVDRLVWIRIDNDDVVGVRIGLECAGDVTLVLNNGSEVEVADCSQFLYARVGNTDYNIGDAYLEGIEMRDGVWEITLRLPKPMA